MQNENASQSTESQKACHGKQKKLKIIVHGVPEADNENIEPTVTDLLNETECTFRWKVVPKA